MNLYKIQIALVLWAILIQTTIAAPTTAVTPAEAKQDRNSASQIYLVKPGDIFGKICQQFQPDGVPLKDVMRLVFKQNPLAFKNHDPAKIIVSSRLVIPDTFLGKPAKTPIQVADPSTTATPSTPLKAPEPTPIIAPTAAKPTTTAPTTVLSDQGEITNTMTSPLPIPNPERENSSLKPILIGIVILILVGAYLIKRKSIVKARKKAMAEVLVDEADSNQEDPTPASAAS